MSKVAWRWLGEDVVLAIHAAQLAEHGGLPGIRDLSLVQSALARPLNLAAYGTPSLPELAAAYAYGLTRNHGFIDGNKRVAFVAAYVFLLDHGHDLAATDEDAVRTMLVLAAGDMTEPELVLWFANNLRPL